MTQLEDASVLHEPHGTEELVTGREELKEVLEGVSKLPDDRREALIMRFALGMDNREIARALGHSEGATKVLIHRAIKQLEESLRRRRRMSDRVEQLLRSALVPIEPPEALSDRLERGLSELTEVAVAELADWELSAMRDPRNWGGRRRDRRGQPGRRRARPGESPPAAEEASGHRPPRAREVDPRRRGRHREGAPR